MMEVGEGEMEEEEGRRWQVSTNTLSTEEHTDVRRSSSTNSCKVTSNTILLLAK